MGKRVCHINLIKIKKIIVFEEFTLLKKEQKKVEKYVAY